MSTEERLRDAIRAKTESVEPAPDGWERITRRMDAPARRAYRPVLLASAAAVLAVVVVAAVLQRGDGRGDRLRAGRTDEPTTVATTAPTTTATTTPTSPPPTTATPGAAAYYLGSRQALWPFASEDEAKAWQASYRSGGHDPWHLDAAQTALSFTTGYLGFTEIDRVVSRSASGASARIGVGYNNPNGQPQTAALIDLVRLGNGADAPWEVVGTTDTQGMSLMVPGYGSTVHSPVDVGGAITGVDESIHVQMRTLSSPTPIGDACCLPAGGQDTPWHTSVAFSGGGGRVVTVVAWTGGHLQGVERFAVTGVRTG
jgi:hypothetical protein